MLTGKHCEFFWRGGGAILDVHFAELVHAGVCGAHGRALRDLRHPIHKAWTIIVAHAVPVKIASPWIGRHVGDRIVLAAKIRRLAKASVKSAIDLRRHAPETCGCIGIVVRH